MIQSRSIFISLAIVALCVVSASALFHGQEFARLASREANEPYFHAIRQQHLQEFHQARAALQQTHASLKSANKLQNTACLNAMSNVLTVEQNNCRVGNDDAYSIFFFPANYPATHTSTLCTNNCFSSMKTAIANVVSACSSPDDLPDATTLSSFNMYFLLFEAMTDFQCIKDSANNYCWPRFNAFVDKANTWMYSGANLNKTDVISTCSSPCVSAINNALSANATATLMGFYSSAITACYRIDGNYCIMDYTAGVNAFSQVPEEAGVTSSAFISALNSMCSACSRGYLNTMLEAAVASNPEAVEGGSAGVRKINAIMDSLCAKMDTGVYCVSLGEKLTAPCPQFEILTAASLKTCPDVCKPITRQIAADLGCCAGPILSMRAQSEDAVTLNITGEALVSWANNLCGVPLTTSCASQSVSGTISIGNIDSKFFGNNSARITAAILRDLQINAGIGGEFTADVTFVSQLIATDALFGANELQQSTGGLRVNVKAQPKQTSDANLIRNNLGNKASSSSLNLASTSAAVGTRGQARPGRGVSSVNSGSSFSTQAVTVQYGTKNAPKKSAAFSSVSISMTAALASLLLACVVVMF